MEEIELIEKYFNGELAESEKRSFEARMNNDAPFREHAERHFAFLKSLYVYADRNKTRAILNEIHEELEPSLTADAKESKRRRISWPTVAVAASVALLCSVGTFIAFRLLDSGRPANYLELVRTVDRLNQSHNQILKDIKKSQKPDIAPGKYSGTGFMVSPNGYVVTSYHVVKSADSLFIENERFGRLKVVLVYHNPSTDVALLLVTDSQFKTLPAIPMSIRNQEGNLGEPVYTLGYPRNEIVYGDGTISATSGFEQNENSYQISIPVNPGNSGGPMIDQQGAVIGIINGVQTQTRGASFAVKSGVLLQEINSIPKDSLATPLKTNSVNQMAGLSRVNQIKRWRDYVFIVKVYHGK
jgi:serine protease Do